MSYLSTLLLICDYKWMLDIREQLYNKIILYFAKQKYKKDRDQKFFKLYIQETKYFVCYLCIHITTLSDTLKTKLKTLLLY